MHTLGVPSRRAFYCTVMLLHQSVGFATLLGFKHFIMWLIFDFTFFKFRYWYVVSACMKWRVLMVQCKVNWLTYGYQALMFIIVR